MRYELKTIPFWPVLKVGFFVNLAVGLLVGVLYAIFLIPFMAVLSSMPALESAEFDIGAAPLGFMMFIIPVISAMSWAFFGTLFLVIVALVYNLVARLVGGIELNLEKVATGLEPVARTAPAAPPRRPEHYSPPPDSRPPPPPPVQPEAPPDDIQPGTGDSNGNIT